jgi:poly(3-hydroxybutyrate) depolymerase
MLYHAYEIQRSWLTSVSAMASIGAEMLTNPALPQGYSGMGPIAASALEVFAHATAPYGKPEFGITDVEVGGKSYAVTEETALTKPFGDLLSLRREGLAETAPKLLIVAPMSGHYATLLRGTAERMLESNHVFITDWADAKTVPLDAGSFDLDDYIDYVIEFLEAIGPNTGTKAKPAGGRVPAFCASLCGNRAHEPSEKRVRAQDADHDGRPD